MDVVHNLVVCIFLCIITNLTALISLFISIATDNHLGYMERDPIRGNDSLESFKEILTIAKDQHVGRLSSH